MLQRSLLWFIHFAPSTKRWFWRTWYNIFARKAFNSDFSFMNYGYAEAGFAPTLNNKDEGERYPIHLYHHVTTQAEIKGKDLLEIGSGRGGGASYIARYLEPGSVHGIDISSAAVDLCSKIHTVDNLSFSEGDSENLLFSKNFYDVVLNVESSHCYGDVDQFIKEVYRVLRPGGVFLWADFRPVESMEGLFKKFYSSGFQLITKKDITLNIIEALDLLTESRKTAIGERVPKPIRKVFESYAGLRGGSIHNAFLSGELIYMSAAFKKSPK
tara:strand:- start:5008 stop:5817 length:810 start_codon:yes stop_codon:yes gene_type:complete